MLIKQPETSILATEIIHTPLQLQRRFVWAAGKTATGIYIPHGIPPGSMPGESLVKPMIRLGEGAFVWTFGWTPNGLHWVLFGIDDEDPQERASMAEFPAFLRLACSDSNLEVRRPEGTAPILQAMKRAFALREP